MPGDDEVEAERAAMLARAAELAAEHERASALAALPDLATARRDAVDELARALDRLGATAVVTDAVATPYPTLVAAFAAAFPDTFWSSPCWVRTLVGRDGTTTVIADSPQADQQRTQGGRDRAKKAAVAALDAWGTPARSIDLVQDVGWPATGSYRRTPIIVRLTSSGHALPETGGAVEWGTEDEFREACAATLAHYRAG